MDHVYDRLEALLKRAERRLAQKFLRAVKGIRSQARLEELVELVRRGELGEALLEVERSLTLIATGYVEMYVAAAEDVARSISAVASIDVEFDRVNQFAVQELQRARVDLVQRLSAEHQSALRAVLVETQTSPITIEEAARRIRSSVGLNTKQVAAVQNYRRLLESGSSEALRRQLRDRRFDSTVRRGGLSSSQIERIVDRYRQRLIAERAKTIALTEGLAAVNAGSEAMFQQAVEQGILDPDAIERLWKTAFDSRVRDSHDDMHDQPRPFGVPFRSGLGNLLRYPGDPRAPRKDRIRCRCTVSTRYRLMGEFAA